MKLRVNEPSYPVHIGRDLVREARRAARPGPKALLYDRAVAAFAHQVADALEIPHRLGVAGGETAKTLEGYRTVLSWLASLGVPRDATLYVVGGGTLTDLGGFVAATYLRGIAYVSWPTTTLAVVDASVGGKTGINLPEGKNLVGAFHAPTAVYADLETLRTLPPPAFKEGLVEAFKHGLIAGDQVLLEPFALSPTHPDLEAYLARAVAVKIRVVEADYTEQGKRRALNLGHTLAHALEAATHHAFSHGEAVAYGLVYAALLGRALGGADLLSETMRLVAWLKPRPYPDLSWRDLEPFLARDKKKHGAEVHWVVPLALGKLVVRPVERRVLEEAYREFLEVVR